MIGFESPLDALFLIDAVSDVCFTPLPMSHCCRAILYAPLMPPFYIILPVTPHAYADAFILFISIMMASEPSMRRH